jgi:hypothetical protein
VVGLLDDAEAYRSHHLARLDGGHVLLSVAHPEPVGRINRQVTSADEHLAIERPADCALAKLEVTAIRQAFSTRDEDILAVDGHHAPSYEAAVVATGVFSALSVPGGKTRDVTVFPVAGSPRFERVVTAG